MIIPNPSHTTAFSKGRLKPIIHQKENHTGLIMRELSFISLFRHIFMLLRQDIFAQTRAKISTNKTP